ncbi:hypothetical protein [Bradyrhizobium sp. CCBAU 51627]|uniref:hypothetical protein n=1 Tax=Bradyrhizobium sp. CCBAU 51627 TaxID=1325088 RepID=UPI002306AE95|nr:hypothetical protein [Bradyrhizobium sp. CCBAU 51627]
MADRIAALRAEIDAVIDQMAADEAKKTPGVPQVVIRQMLTRGGDCQCRSYLIQTGAVK